MTRVASSNGDLADPKSAAWAEVEKESVGLSPIPLDAQPTEYIRTAWADRPYGKVDSVDVSAAAKDGRLYVRLEWQDSDTPNTEFADAVGVFFPENGDATVQTIGSSDAPVHLWYWQADRETPLDLVASGPGVFQDSSSPNGLEGAASLDGGRWAVVLSATVPGSGSPSSCGVAVWDGSNEERAGIGAVTQDWIPLEGQS